MNKSADVDANSRAGPAMGFDPCHAPDAPSVHVPGEIESLSEAVLRLGEHGRVVVAPGDYRENIAIQPGTHIILQAEGPERPRLLAAEPELPVVYVAPEAKFYLIGMSLHGVRSGLVAGMEATGEAVHSVTLINTRVG